MPSRVAVVAKIVVCAPSSLNGSRPGTPVSAVVTQPQSRKLHVPTQNTLLSTPKPVAAPRNRTVSASPSSLLYQSSHLSHRHRQHHSYKMDAALAKIFVSNSQWIKAVNTAEPGFFEQSAKGQSPKMR